MPDDVTVRLDKLETIVAKLAAALRGTHDALAHVAPVKPLPKEVLDFVEDKG